MNKVAWFLFAFFSCGVGIYPLLYALTSERIGLLQSKSDVLLDQQAWWIAFYIHIFFGGITLLTGWSQFSKKLRTKRLNLHRGLGKIYVITVFISGSAALYLAINANEGMFAQTGFLMMDVSWLTCTLLAYLAIKKKDFDSHRAWMLRSFAVCWAAVTLRIWMPLFGFAGIPLSEGYPIIAWVSWVPNLFIAQWFITRK